MRPEIEPLNFRTVIVKDFVVDLKEFKAEEIKLNFQQRVWHYGLADNDNSYWLFSNGYLYSYNPNKDFLDSIYVCEPAEKGDYTLELVKGYDYPTVLHKQNSTYWICFFPTKELYKINLKTKKIDRIFKTCVDKKDCVIPTAPIDIYDFDSSRIYFQSGFNSFLINAANDSITYYSDLFNNKLREEGQVGSGIYGNWICQVTTTEINMLNTVSGSQRKLLLNEDFKWQLSQFNSRPLVNDRGEMILMGKDRRGFVVFNLDSVAAAEKPGIVRFSFIKVNDRELLLDSLMKRGALTLKYNGYNSIHFQFSDYSLLGQERLIYEYTLYNGGDTIWNKIEGEPELSFTRITPGSYTLLVRVGNGFGGYSPEITVFNILITPPFTQTVWFIGLIIVTIAAILYVVYLYRLKQLKKLQIIRNNIASDLHDDIGSTLNSISIYSEVAKQQAGKEIPALDQIGLNSRKIIESMSDIVWTINPENDPFEKIIIRMRSFAYQLLKAKKVEYTFEVDEKLNSIALPMQVRKNFYLVFKEAITNVVKYSEASRVSIDLFEKNKTIMLRIRDNGKGIPVNAQTLGNGLMNMTRRAEEIGGELNIISANDGGTEIELMLKT
jgi:two-component sensor histidine kinase